MAENVSITTIEHIIEELEKEAKFDWFRFGVYLNIPLDNILSFNGKSESAKELVLQHHLSNWSIIHALRKIGKHLLADKLLESSNGRKFQAKKEQELPFSNTINYLVGIQYTVYLVMAQSVAMHTPYAVPYPIS